MIKQLLNYIATECSLTIGETLFLGLQDWQADGYICAMVSGTLPRETDGTELGTSIVQFVAFSRSMGWGSAKLDSIEELLANKSRIALQTEVLESVTGGSAEYDGKNERGYDVHVLTLRIVTKRR